jgi:hypothetical protein
MLQKTPMTYTQPQVNASSSNEPSEDLLSVALEMQAAAHLQITADVARLKAMGKPIYYSIGKKSVRENADGRRFEFQLSADGIEEILGEIV